MQVNSTIKTSQPAGEMRRQMVTPAQIETVKRDFILDNLLMTPAEVGQLLGVSPRTVLDRVKDGKIDAADDSGRVSAGVRITARSVQAYAQSIIIPAEKHTE